MQVTAAAQTVVKTSIAQDPSPPYELLIHDGRLKYCNILCKYSVRSRLLLRAI